MKQKFSVFFLLLSVILTMPFLLYKKQIAKAESIFDYKSKAYYTIDYNTGTEIIKNDEYKHLPIASMTKVMTLLLCFEALDNNQINLQDEICISKNASGMGGSQVFLEENGKYIVSDLIKSIIVASANDSCVAMAEVISGSESQFVCRMNEKCSELELNNTNFVNCTGLPCVGQYSCAKDVAVMFSNLLNHKEYFNYSTIWMDEISHSNNRITSISNTNKLLKSYNGCDAGKTGYTQEAGHCLVASAKRNDTRLISVVIGAPDSKTRFNEVSEMLNYGLSNYSTKKLIDKEQVLSKSFSVCGGKQTQVKIQAENDFYVFTQNNKKRSFNFEFIPLKDLKAPVIYKQKVGEVIVYEDSVEICRLNLVAANSIAKKNYFDCVKDCIDNGYLIG